MARYPNLESAMYATQSIQLCEDILKEGVTELSMGDSVYLAIVSDIFLKPIHIGDLVTLDVEIIKIGKTSSRIQIDVFSTHLIK